MEFDLIHCYNAYSGQSQDREEGYIDRTGAPGGNPLELIQTEEEHTLHTEYLKTLAIMFWCQSQTSRVSNPSQKSRVSIYGALSRSERCHASRQDFQDVIETRL